MENWITNIMNDFGYIGIMLLVALENVFPPIPSEIILTFGGFMTQTTDLSVPGVIVASTVGSVAGAVILYGVGLLFDVERLEKIIDRWGHVLHLTKKDIHRADGWFDNYGGRAVFLCRFVPLMRSLISIPAGMSNMKWIPFLFLTTVGTLIWNTVLVLLGAFVGESWEVIVDYLSIYSRVIYVLLAIMFIGAVFFYLKKRKERGEKKENG